MHVASSMMEIKPKNIIKSQRAVKDIPIITDLREEL